MDEVWTQWSARRPSPHLIHLDSAAAGRQSTAVLDAVTAHARHEAEIGAYVAQRRVADVLDRLHDDLGAMLGIAPDGVALVESATAGLQALLRAWPLPADATVGVLPVEWGPNLETFAWHGVRPVELPAGPDGRLDPDAFGRLLATDPPDVVHLTHVTSHRGLVQPAAAAAGICRAAGVPLWVDAAQALGHVDTAIDADAVYATSRKWLTGPRGVGVLAIDARHHDRLRVQRSDLDPGLPTVRYLESHEAHVPGRIGLAAAIREYLDDGPVRVHARLTDVGRETREALADVPGWAVTPAAEPEGAITALRPTAGQDVAATAARLLDEHGILTTAGAVARAPRDVDVPLLRVSPHVDCTPDHLEKLRAALSRT